jgi:hypothetical protein
MSHKNVPQIKLRNWMWIYFVLIIFFQSIYIIGTRFRFSPYLVIEYFRHKETFIDGIYNPHHTMFTTRSVWHFFLEIIKSCSSGVFLYPSLVQKKDDRPDIYYTYIFMAHVLWIFFPSDSPLSLYAEQPVITKMPTNAMVVGHALAF